MTFRELHNMWRDTKGLYVKASTLSVYDLWLRNRILPKLGDIRVEDIKTSVMQSFLNDILATRVSLKTARDIMIVVKMILRYGADMELTPYRNFSLKYPTQNIMDKAKSIDIYTTDEQNRISKYVIENPSTRNLGILICLCTGMRIGEICALKWDDIDMENRLINIKRTVQRIYLIGDSLNRTQIEFSSPKTIDSNRCIPIQKNLYSLLKKYSAVSNGDYFVISGSRCLIEPRVYRNFYKNFIVDKVRLDRCIKFHGLRHTFATRLIESGAEVTAVSKIMGHSNVSITMNLYVHPTLANKAECINRSLKSLFGN